MKVSRETTGTIRLCIEGTQHEFAELLEALNDVAPIGEFQIPDDAVPVHGIRALDGCGMPAR